LYEREVLARKIFETSNLKGEFQLRSGITSDEYFDKYLFKSDPQLLIFSVNKAGEKHYD